MENSELRYIQKLISHTEESIRYFSISMKAERERSVCAALLRCLGVVFEPRDIEAISNDPPDVKFDLARFEVIEIYDKKRKRHDEYKDRLKELQKAKTINETLIPYESPKPISYHELSTEITRALGIKSRKYGKRFCATLDALVSIGLSNHFLDIRSEIPDYVELMDQGWRSVSFVMPPFGHVAFCECNGPKFLASISRQTKHEWKYSDDFFDLQEKKTTK